MEIKPLFYAANVWIDISKKLKSDLRLRGVGEKKISYLFKNTTITWKTHIDLITYVNFMKMP